MSSNGSAKQSPRQPTSLTFASIFKASSIFCILGSKFLLPAASPHKAVPIRIQGLDPEFKSSQRCFATDSSTSNVLVSVTKSFTIPS